MELTTAKSSDGKSLPCIRTAAVSAGSWSQDRLGRYAAAIHAPADDVGGRGGPVRRIDEGKGGSRRAGMLYVGASEGMQGAMNE